MNRGPKPQPTHLKLVKGNPGRRPIRPDKIQPPARRKVLSPPAHLSNQAKAEWKRLAPMLTKLGLLSDLDRATFAAYCECWSTVKRTTEALEDLARKDATGFAGMLITTTGGNTIQNPLIGIRNRAMDMMVKYAAEFGFTPSARARVHDDAPGAAKSGAAGFFDD